jgi:hypothetical protein
MGTSSLGFAQSTSSTLGLVYSSANPTAQSLIRIYNGTSNNDWDHSGMSLTLTLRDGSTGAAVGQWVSPALKAGVSQQFAISEIESGLAPGTVKPATYIVTATSSHTGMAIQHLMVRKVDGVISNMTECDTGVATHGKALLNVYSSQAASYQSTVVITNSGATQSALKIEIYDAENGFYMGQFSSPIIPAGGQVIMSAAAIEAAAQVRPPRYYGRPLGTYVIRFGRSYDGGYNFIGFLQNLVSTTQAGAVTDLTAYCPVGGPEPAFRRDEWLRTGPLFASSNSNGQSYIQVANTGAAAGTMTVTLQDPTSATSFGTWTSPSIPAGAAQAFSISDIESAIALPATKPTQYSAKVQATFGGEIQHIFRGNVDATPSDLSTCDLGTGATTSQLNGVNASQLNATFPSTVVITNTGAASAPVTLGIYDAATGTKLGTATTPSVAAYGHLSLSSTELEAAAQITPTAAQKYVVRVEGAFTGFLQHLVANTNTGAVSDVTLSCKLQTVISNGPGTIENQPPLGATIADVPAGVDLHNLPGGIDLSRLSESLRNLILGYGYQY